MSEHDCLNNEDQLDSVLDEVAQIDSEFDPVDDIDSDLEKVVEVIIAPFETISVNGEHIEPDENKNVNIEIPTKTSGLENDGDGTSPFVTENNVKDRFSELVGLAPETLDTLEEIANELGENETAINSLARKIDEVKDSIQTYNAGEGLSLDAENKFSIAPATEKTFGGVRVWEENDYLCFSTEPYSAFINSVSNGVLAVSGVWSALQEGSVLTIQ